MTRLDLYFAYLAVSVSMLVLGLAIAFIVTAWLCSQELLDHEPSPLLGSLACVVVKIAVNRTGEVLCLCDEDRQYYPARAADGHNFDVGSVVTVSDWVSGVVLVQQASATLQGEFDVDSD